MNDSDATINEIIVAYTGEQWRRGNVEVVNTLDFVYGLGSSIDAASLASFAALTFISPVMSEPTEVALNGNLAANQTALSATLSGLNWGAGLDGHGVKRRSL